MVDQGKEREGSAECKLQGLEHVNPCRRTVVQCQKWASTEAAGDGPLPGRKEERQLEG